ncbi:DHHC palmitoyltransferase-domain-containing protein [Lipomyces oligophaga]|uniref:DHHC palmitoyltransferase-domain-containing protein n=1 Tax=Lipomyces oligophaga TaxID=45792 RepID=UPI0034CE2BE5
MVLISPMRSDGVAAQLNVLCMSMATAFPWILTNSLLAWAAYVLIIRIGLRSLSGCLSFFIVVFGSYFYLQCVICYVMIVRNGAVGPPRTLVADPNQELDLESGGLLPPNAPSSLGILTKDNGQKRFCSKCKIWKPDRTHHCSTCGRCVLRMDHHCPWFSTCIGFANYKVFILFLGYVVLFCVVCFVGSGVVLLDYIETIDESGDLISLNLAFLFILSIVFGIAVTIFFSLQLYLLFSNKTTIEAMETQRYRSNIAANAYRYSTPPSSKSVGNVFDLGLKQNFVQMMGSNPLLWFFPVVNSRGNGTTFPVNITVLTAIKRQADQESQMLNNLHATLSRNSLSSNRSSNVITSSAEDEYNGRVSVEFRPS